MVSPRHRNSRGNPGSPAAIREVSQVATMGVIASLIRCSDMIIYEVHEECYRVVLNIFSAEGTLFHFLSLLVSKFYTLYCGVPANVMVSYTAPCSVRLSSSISRERTEATDKTDDSRRINMLSILRSIS
jgi:hypothetical protein